MIVMVIVIARSLLFRDANAIVHRSWSLSASTWNIEGTILALFTFQPSPYTVFIVHRSSLEYHHFTYSHK